MSRVRPTAERVALATALASALLALTLALRAPWLLPLLLAALVSPLLEWRKVPPAARAGLPGAAGLVLVAAFIVLFFSRPVPLLADAVRPLLIVPAVATALLATAFAFGPAAFPPGRSLVPAVVGLLAIAGFDPAPAGFPASRLLTFEQAGFNRFADAYLLLATCSALALWTAALIASAPPNRRRLALAAAGALLLAGAGVVALPAAQPRIERMLAAQVNEAETGLSAGSTLGEYAALARSRRRVLDLHAAPAIAAGWLLRAEVLTSFDGGTWRREHGSTVGTLRPASFRPAGALLADLGRWFVPSPAASGPPGPEGALRINRHELEGWPLLLPRSVSAIVTDAPWLELDRFGLARAPVGRPVRLYGALLRDRVAGPSTLGEEQRLEALQLPTTLDPRVRALASELARGRASARERLASTLRHLAGYEYTLQPGALGPDPIADFLFKTKRGYCEYFASAAVVLLRLQGVPARLVKGFRVSPQDDCGDGLFVVRESDAHAWLEAWLADEGWVEADPTPAGLGSTQEPPGPFARGLEHARAALLDAWARASGRDPGAIARWLGRNLAGLVAGLASRPLWPIALACVLLAPRLARAASAWRRRRRQRRADHAPAAPPELRQLVAEVEDEWRRLGLARPRSRGLAEHARAVAGGSGDAAPQRSAAASARAASPGLAAASRAIVEAYYRARFGGESLPRSELARLRSAWLTAPRSRRNRAASAAP